MNVDQILKNNGSWEILHISVQTQSANILEENKMLNYGECKSYGYSTIKKILQSLKKLFSTRKGWGSMLIPLEDNHEEEE